MPYIHPAPTSAGRRCPICDAPMRPAGDAPLVTVTPVERDADPLAGPPRPPAHGWLRPWRCPAGHLLREFQEESDVA